MLRPKKKIKITKLIVWLVDCRAINSEIRDSNWQAPNSTWQIVTNVVLKLVPSLLVRNVLHIKFILKYIIVLLYELHSKLYGILNSKRSIALYPWRNCVLVSDAFVLGRVLIHFFGSFFIAYIDWSKWYSMKHTAPFQIKKPLLVNLTRLLIYDASLTAMTSTKIHIWWQKKIKDDIIPKRCSGLIHIYSPLNSIVYCR